MLASAIALRQEAFDLPHERHLSAFGLKSILIAGGRKGVRQNQVRARTLDLNKQLVGARPY